MKATQLLLLAVLSVFCFCRESKTAEYFVNNIKGKDSNTGTTPDQAFATLKKATSVLKSADMLSIAKTGTPYSESLKIGGKINPAGKPIIINGNNAVLNGMRPLSNDKWTKKDDNSYLYKAPAIASHCSPSLYINGKKAMRAPKGKKATTGMWDWTGEGIIYIPQKDEKFSNLQIKATMLESGVIIVRSSNMLIKNIICENFYNDGFNIHGDSQGLLFENITGRFNGDDGFSIHEDGGAVIRNSHFHNNTYGIEDVNASRSYYNGVLIENNQTGVQFSGGMHELVNCTIKDNTKSQVTISSGYGSYYLGSDRYTGPYANSTFIKNCWISGKATGISVIRNATLTLINSTFSNCTRSLIIKDKGLAFIRGCVFDKSSELDISVPKGSIMADCNIYDNCKIKYDNKQYQKNNFKSYIEISGQDKNSLCKKPELQKNGMLKDRSRILKLTPGLTTKKYIR